MPDLLHRFHNDVVLAERECGMLELRLECKIALGMKHGSWNSNANANLLKAASIEYFSLHGPSNILFEALYEDLVHANPEWSCSPDAGSEQHIVAHSHYGLSSATLKRNTVLVAVELKEEFVCDQGTSCQDGYLGSISLPCMPLEAAEVKIVGMVQLGSVVERAARSKMDACSGSDVHWLEEIMVQGHPQ
eukprot:1558385-Amphidinium_carterae.1